jgi:hypothetical protein
MRDVHGLAVHERAAADDGRDAEFGTDLQGRVGDAAGAKRPMKPDMCDAPNVGLADEFGCDGRMRGDDEAIQRAGNRGEIGIALDALELVGIGIDGHNLVTRRAEPAKDSVGRLVRRSGDTGNHETLALQKPSYGFRKSLHIVPQPFSKPPNPRAHLPRQRLDLEPCEAVLPPR